MKNCSHFKPFLMGFMDNELTPEETAEVNEHLIRCTACREEYEQLRDTAEKIGAISFVEPQDEVLKNLWRTPYSRLTRNTGLFLVIGGYLCLIIYALFELLVSGDTPVFPKITIAAVIIGFFVLLGSVIRERMHTYKTDPYKEIER